MTIQHFFDDKTKTLRAFLSRVYFYPETREKRSFVGVVLEFCHNSLSWRTNQPFRAELLKARFVFFRGNKKLETTTKAATAATLLIDF